jgi:hypothetical protein
LSPGARDEDARAVGEGGERASPPSSAPREYTSRNPKAAKSARSASIEADLERARAAARAADDAASIAEQEHEAFLMANKLLLDARAAQAETSRAAALRAAEVAARARAAAEDAARLAAAKHELALAEAQSESCAYAVESAALRAELDESNGALTSSYGFSEPACLTNAKKAELRREATERVANAARKEHAEAAAALVRGRAEAAKPKRAPPPKLKLWRSKRPKSPRRGFLETKARLSCGTRSMTSTFSRRRTNGEGTGVSPFIEQKKKKRT